MFAISFYVHSSRLLPVGGLFAAVVLLFPGVVRAQSTTPQPIAVSPITAVRLLSSEGRWSTPQCGVVSPRDGMGAAAAEGRLPVLLAGAWNVFWQFLEDNLNNRRRMLQFGVLGMCLALYIMIWRR
jgi:hypothetical protein